MLTREQLISYKESYLKTQNDVTEAQPSHTMGLAIALILLTDLQNLSNAAVNEEKQPHDNNHNHLNNFTLGLQLAIKIDNKNINAIDPVAKSIIKKLLIQNTRAIPMTFKDAMALFYRQAKNLLYHFSFSQTPEVIKKLILTAYNDKHCLPYETDPVLFSDETVRKYLNELRIFDSNFVVKGESKNASAIFKEKCPADYSVATRLNILSAISPYADMNNSADVETLKFLYAYLTSLISSTLPPDTTRYVSTLQYTNMLDTPIIGKEVALTVACKKLNSELVTALLECPTINTDQLDQKAGYLSLSEFAYIEKGQDILTLLLGKNPSLAMGISAEALCQPCLAPNSAGESPLFWLASTEKGRDILTLLLEKNSSLAMGISAEALCRAGLEPNSAGESPLFWLLGSEKGRNILALLLEKNPSLAMGISAEALCRPCLAPNRAGESPLFWLVGPEKGLDIFALSLEKNLSLAMGISAEALCRPCLTPNRAGESPLFWLAGTKKRRDILALLLEKNPSLATDISAEALCRPCLAPNSVGESPLFWLASSEKGRNILALLLEKNPSLAMGISAEALCRPCLAPNIANTSPLFWLAGSVKGQNILALLLEKNPSLAMGISVDALCKSVNNTPSVLDKLVKHVTGSKILARLMQNPKLENALNQKINGETRKNSGSLSTSTARLFIPSSIPTNNVVEEQDSLKRQKR